MNLTIISASPRLNSQSSKVAQYIADVAIGFNAINHLELCSKNLPVWDGEQQSKEDDSSDWLNINSQLKNTDALILITPEWSGTASPLLKNFLMMCEGQVTAHKPVLLVSVSSGGGGTYPIAELRMNAFKNNKLVAIPDHLIIRNVENVLNSSIANSTNNEPTLTTRDSSIRAHINYSLHTLKHYAQAHKQLRESLSKQPFLNEHHYAYGM